jgi:hypothetical protein
MSDSNSGILNPQSQGDMINKIDIQPIMRYAVIITQPVGVYTIWLPYDCQLPEIMQLRTNKIMIIFWHLF